MNPLALEQDLQAALEAYAFPDGNIYCGTDSTLIASQQTAIIINVGAVEYPAPSIYRATVNFQVVAPALMGGSVDADSYAAMQSSIDTLLSSITNDYMTAYWPSASPLRFKGLWHANTQKQEHVNDWHSELSFVFGLSI